MIPTIDRVTGIDRREASSTRRPEVARRHTPPTADGRDFTAQLTVAASGRSLRLSNHALDRIAQRQIHVADRELDRLRSAFDQLASRGGRQSLVLLDHVAYVVDVPSQTVVTAVRSDEGKEAVFTNLDSAIVA